MVRSVMYYHAAILVLVWAGTTGADSQNFRNYDTEPVQAGARAASLANASASDPYDVNAMYWNPAALSFLSTRSVVINSFVSWDKLTLMNSAAYPLRIDDQQTTAIGVMTNYHSYFKYRSANLAYALQFSPVVSGGIFLDAGQAASRTEQQWSGSASVGFLYAPGPGITYGIVYRGIGSDIHYFTDLRTIETLARQTPQHSLIVATTFWFPSVSRRPYMSMSAEAEKVFGVASFTSRAGIEILPFGFFAIRCGIVTTPVNSSGRAGFGLLFGGFHIDYAVAPSVAESRFHQLTVAIPL